MDLMVRKYRFAKDMANKLMTFGSNRKISGVSSFREKGHV